MSDIYAYDLRSRMTSDVTTTTAGTTTTDYAYDTSGVLASETTPSTGSGQATTIYYLNDPNNPTGYTKAIQESTTLAGPATLSYVLGLKVEGQSDATNGTLYLITDGHGSTRALVNLSGGVVQTYDYDAFGDAMDFNPNHGGHDMAVRRRRVLRPGERLDISAWLVQWILVYAVRHR